jgi:predicted dehydrogenase
MEKKVKFAVAGCGSIGKRHIAVLDAEPNAELVAICDIDEKKFSQSLDNFDEMDKLSKFIRTTKNVKKKSVRLF